MRGDEGGRLDGGIGPPGEAEEPLTNEPPAASWRDWASWRRWFVWFALVVPVTCLAGVVRLRQAGLSVRWAVGVIGATLLVCVSLILLAVYRDQRGR